MKRDKGTEMKVSYLADIYLHKRTDEERDDFKSMLGYREEEIDGEIVITDPDIPLFRGVAQECCLCICETIDGFQYYLSPPSITAYKWRFYPYDLF